MSSQSFQQLTPIKTKLGEIDCTAKFSEQFSHLCMNQDYSDVTFVVDGTKLKAHRVIMASRSQYFRALLYGSYMESELNEIPLTVPSLAAFKALLSYIYSGVLSLNKLDNNVVLDILGLANQYDFNELEEAISKYLQQILSIENACPILSSASLYNLESLVNDCHEFMDRNAVNILKDESFLLLSEDSVCGLLKRNSFYAPEVVIYKSIAAWFKNNPKADIKKVLALLRLETMQLSHLLDVVRPSGILEADLILDAIATQNSNEYLNFRGILTVQENVAATRLGARAIKGRNNATLLDGDARTYDLESGYTSHSIDGDVSDNCIEVELGGIYIINHIKLLLWDRDIRSYSYYVEVSIDQKIYKRVVDFSAFYARSWQSLYFPQLPVRFIRTLY